MKKSTISYLIFSFFISFNLSSSSVSNPNLPITIPIYSGDLPSLYTIPLNFGTEPQTVHLVMDITTSFVWCPCGDNFNSSSKLNLSYIPRIFYPKISSTWNPVKCNNPKCWWITAKRDQPQCSHCNNRPSDFRNCSDNCPHYEFECGQASTKGALLLETLHFDNHIERDFVFGCSRWSHETLPLGSVGFGRGLDSLPSQMNIKKFSYCLPSGFSYSRLHKTSETNDEPLSYTKIHTFTSPLRPNFKHFYYVLLEEILVGNVVVKIPKRLQLPDHKGNGGTILDTSSTIATRMNGQIYSVLANEFIKQMGRESFIANIAHDSGPCFQVSNRTSFPKLVFRFRGHDDHDWASLELPVWNYLGATPLEKNVLCFSILHYNHDPDNLRPAVIFGSFQQRDVYFEYDLENERLGFRRRNCEEKSERVLKMWK